MKEKFPRLFMVIGSHCKCPDIVSKVKTYFDSTIIKDIKQLVLNFSIINTSI
jgi:hypothetical protein